MALNGQLSLLSSMTAMICWCGVRVK